MPKGTTIVTLTERNNYCNLKGTTIVNLRKRNNADENVRNCQAITSEMEIIMAIIKTNGNVCLLYANNHKITNTLMHLSLAIVKEIWITKWKSNFELIQLQNETVAPSDWALGLQKYSMRNSKHRNDKNTQNFHWFHGW